MNYCTHRTRAFFYLTHSLHWKKKAAHSSLLLFHQGIRKQDHQLARKQLTETRVRLVLHRLSAFKTKNTRRSTVTMGRDDDEPPSPEEWSCFHHHRVAARGCVLTPLVAERWSQLNKQVAACRALCLHDTVHMCASRAGERGLGEGVVFRVDRLWWEAAPAFH